MSFIDTVTRTVFANQFRALSCITSDLTITLKSYATIYMFSYYPNYVKGIASTCNYTLVGQVSDLMISPKTTCSLKTVVGVSPVCWPIGIQLTIFFCSRRISVFLFLTHEELSSTARSIVWLPQLKMTSQNNWFWQTELSVRHYLLISSSLYAIQMF